MNERKMCLRGLLLVSVAALALLALLLLGSSVKADGPQFNVSCTTDVSDTDCLANADILSTFNIGDDPWPAAQYEAQISFTPVEWGVPESADIPIGAIVGTMHVNATLGWFNNPCAAVYGGSISFPFDPLMNCSIDTSDTIAYTDPDFFADSDGNGIPGGCDKWPEFLNTMFPGMTPITRHAGFEFIGINVSLSFLTFEPGTSIPETAAPGVPPFSPDLGYVAMSVLNDPTAPLVKNQITDFCPPLATETVNHGLTRDNPNTAGVDESGYAWRTNPECAGTYTFNVYTHSIGDADGDNIDNDMDTCPHVPNAGDPRVMYSGDNDGDGIPNECDDTPTTTDVDVDGDGFPNRQDNCPLVDNEDQADGDYDGIGDACDQDDWNDDGDITDPGEPTGFSAGTPNGENTVVWCASDVEISGPSCCEEIVVVPIDIKPGSDPNSINLGCHGVIPVAILTTEDFDATTVDADTVRFGPGEAEKAHKRAHVEDVDRDGDLDMVLHFKCQETGIEPDAEEACLQGTTYDGQDIQGCDSVRIVPPRSTTDSDGDAFTDAAEACIGSDLFDACPDNPSHDAWPLDISMDRMLTVAGDVLNFRDRIGATPGSPEWSQRLDLNMDGAITVAGDALFFRGMIGESCT